MIVINYCGQIAFQLERATSIVCIKDEVKKHLGLCANDYYLLNNGKRFINSHVHEECTIHIVPKLVGGKGGFGSMLRAIGAQIEKTTNREACRDLSGRRLRDINEEKRLKSWIAQQVEREKEADDRKLKKLERLCQVPKHEFKDENYEKERSDLTEKVEDALEQGLKASTSTSGKRKQPSKEISKAKKKKIWLGSEDELSSSTDIDSEDDANSKESENNVKDVGGTNKILIDEAESKCEIKENDDALGAVENENISIENKEQVKNELKETTNTKSE